MSVEAISIGNFDLYPQDDDYLENRFLKSFCDKITKTFANQKVWLSQQAKPLCPNKHLAKYAVIDRTKSKDDPERIVWFLCEYHGCPFDALTYQAKALLPHQYILAIEYLKEELKRK